MSYTKAEKDEDTNDNNNANNVIPQILQSINEFGSITTKGLSGIIHCITIIGQIEGHYILPAQNKSTKYEHVIPQLVAIEESKDIEGLLVLLNTVGGDVEAGLAIAEMLSSMQKPVVSLVLGGGHSIGVPLAVAADVSFIAPTATMTVHPVRLNGVVLGVPQSFNYVDKMQERVVQFVVNNSKITAETFRKMMTNTTELASDIGTVLNAQMAVECGLVDKVGGLKDALATLADFIRARRELVKRDIEEIKSKEEVK